MIIEYKGERIETKHYTPITDEYFNQLRNEYFAKPDIEEVKNQMYAISKGGMQNNKLTAYYFKDLMSKVKLYSCKWSVEEVFECKDLVSFFISKTEDNKNIFTDDMPMIEKLGRAIQIGGKGCALPPTNFPLKTINDVLNFYNINGNYYDFSCGWGVRLTGALRHRMNYFGTDPNYLLTERLQQLARDYKSVVVNNSIVDIRTQGSQYFIPEWENKIGLAFSSPPYFYLEDYKIGDQSYKEGTSYESWKSDYLKPTFENINKYLIDDGYFLLNINNFDKFHLVEDSIEIAQSLGFHLIGEHTLFNIKRVKSSGGFNDNSERILVFNKNAEKKVREANRLF